MKVYEGKTCSITYPYSLEGELIITSKLPCDNIGLKSGETRIFLEDLLEFVAEIYVKPKLIQCIENTPPMDILLNQINPEE